MKKNTNNKLAFNKADVTELNVEQLAEVQGGTSTVIGTTSLLGCTFCVSSSNSGRNFEHFQFAD